VCVCCRTDDGFISAHKNGKQETCESKDEGAAAAAADAAAVANAAGTAKAKAKATATALSRRQLSWQQE